MMQPFRKIWCLGLMALLVALPGSALGEMYVEGYLGGVQGANAGMSFSGPSNSLTESNAGLLERFVTREHNIPGRLDPAFLGGLKLGAWFDKSGMLAGINFPDWMKHFGFYLDFSYHRLNFRNQNVASKWVATSNQVEGPVTTFTISTAPITTEFFSNGTAATLGFMFAARYGFLPDATVPFGRLQPYLAVGPAILFASQVPTLTFRGANNVTASFVTKENGVVVNQGTYITQLSRFGISSGSSSDASLALMVDAGLRWMALKNVSIDLFFRYRYARPQFTYRGLASDPFYETSYHHNSVANYSLKPDFHLLSGQLGAAYHF